MIGSRLLTTTINARSQVRRLAALTLVSVVVAAALGATEAHAATSGPCWSNSAWTCHPYMTTTWTPWLSTWSQGPQYWPIAAGTAVDMRCWTTGAYRLNTAKWFRVVSTRYPFTQGYVPANAVGSQIIVGHC
jgi:hypothetical protein